MQHCCALAVGLERSFFKLSYSALLSHSGRRRRQQSISILNPSAYIFSREPSTVRHVLLRRRRCDDDQRRRPPGQLVVCDPHQLGCLGRIRVEHRVVDLLVQADAQRLRPGFEPLPLGRQWKQRIWDATKKNLFSRNRRKNKRPKIFDFRLWFILKTSVSSNFVKIDEKWKMEMARKHFLGRGLRHVWINKRPTKLINGHWHLYIRYSLEFWVP